MADGNVRAAIGALVQASAILIATALVGAEIISQQPSGQVFRAATDLVQLDVSVLDKSGKPVRGLTRGDFTVFEDGKPRPIQAFSTIDVSDAPPAPQPVWADTALSDVATNEVDGRRVFALVLDDASFGLAARKACIQAASRIVERLSADDLATVLFTRNIGSVQGLTKDRARLYAAIASLNPPGTTRSAIASPFGDITLEVIMNAVQSLGAIGGRRKALIYLTGGILGPTGRQGPSYPDWIDIYAAAQSANVNIYPMNMNGLTMGSVDSFLTVASNTGGRAIINTNDFANGIDDVLTRTSAYYLLGYRSSSTSSDGLFHRLNVKVDRKGVTVITRHSYVTPKPKTAAKDAAAAAAAPNQAALADVLPRTDIPLRLSAATFASSASKAAVLLVLQVREPAAAIAGPETVDVLIRAFTPTGESRASATRQFTFSHARSGAAESRDEGVTRIDLAPGRYELRVAAHSSTTDLRGSVYADVTVPDFHHAPLSLSDVVVETGARRVSGMPDALKDVVPILPTTVRSFERVDDVTTFVRVYQADTTAAAAVSVMTRIRDAQDAVVFKESRILDADAFGSAHACDVLTALPMARLVPGDYLLSYEAALGKSSATREVRFTVK